MKRLSILIPILLIFSMVAGFLANGASDIPGDVDLDGNVTAEDALLVLRTSSGTDTLTAAQVKLADVTYDGKINSVDALRILLYISGSISDLGNVGSEEGDDIII